MKELLPGEHPGGVQRLQKPSAAVVVPLKALNRKQFCLSCVLECGRELERAGEMILTVSI